MEKEVYYLWLHLLSGLTAYKKIRLVKHFGDPQAVYAAKRSDLSACDFMQENMIRALSNKNLRLAGLEEEKAKKLGISLLLYGTPEYPKILEEISDPPLVLYAKGDFSVLHKRAAFCIVGARHCTAYGMSAALGIAEQLARCGMVIVSGCAVGIDTGAHRGAIRGGGKTIGIMGCGLDVNYPAENADVRASIIQNGVLISEFPLGTPPYGTNFPLRNRLLSAFSLGVAVMEAGQKSGSLITAKYAAEQGRDVFALPGNISSPLSSGTNQLIQDGAALLTGADAILEEYILRFPALFSFEQEEKESETFMDKCLDALQNTEMTDDEKKLYNMIGKDTVHVDVLARKMDLPVSAINALLTVLQVRGKIKTHAGNYISK